MVSEENGGDDSFILISISQRCISDIGPKARSYSVYAYAIRSAVHDYVYYSTGQLESCVRVPAWRQIKTLIYVTDTNEKVLVSLRGDLDVSEAKLLRAIGCSAIVHPISGRWGLVRYDRHEPSCCYS